MTLEFGEIRKNKPQPSLHFFSLPTLTEKFDQKWPTFGPPMANKGPTKWPKKRTFVAPWCNKLLVLLGDRYSTAFAVSPTCWPTVGQFCYSDCWAIVGCRFPGIFAIDPMSICKQSASCSLLGMFPLVSTVC